jgi:hypothetical protein
MKRIAADFDRSIHLEGVGPVSRPVDIEQAMTGFNTLRTLRVYRFEPGAVIDGHAEEDEVFILVLAGEVELTMTAASQEGAPTRLGAPGASGNIACAAYLPPHGAYRLVPKTQADIAYVRATPEGGKPPRTFTPTVSQDLLDVMVLLDEDTYAEKLRVRLVRIEASQGDVIYQPIEDAEAKKEALVHLRNPTAGSDVRAEDDASSSMVLESWDTIVVSPGERLRLRFARSSALLLTVLADSRPVRPGTRPGMHAPTVRAYR